MEIKLLSSTLKNKLNIYLSFINLFKKSDDTLRVEIFIQIY